MAFKIIEKQLDGLALIEPAVFGDERGFFMESFRADQFEELNLPTNFVQDNHSRSKYGVLRGLHFQYEHTQGKLIRVTFGKIQIVEVDIRRNSAHFGKYYSTELSDENKRMLWVPPGFANGFCGLSEFAEVQYKCTDFWDKSSEMSLLWNDPEININWQVENPILSEKDANGLTLTQWVAHPASKNL